MLETDKVILDYMRDNSERFITIILPKIPLDILRYIVPILDADLERREAIAPPPPF